MTTETWRAELDSGAIGCLGVADAGGGWHDVDGRQYHPATPLRAAIAHAAWERDWAVVEIVAPGELTRAEAVAAMRERCIAAFATWLRRHDALAGAREIADEVEEEGAAVLAEIVDALPAVVTRG